MPRKQESIKFVKNAFFGFEIFCASISTASTFESGGLIFSLFWDIYQNPMKVGDVAGDVRQGPNHGGGSNLPVFFFSHLWSRVCKVAALHGIWQTLAPPGIQRGGHS